MYASNCPKSTSNTKSIDQCQTESHCLELETDFKADCVHCARHVFELVLRFACRKRKRHREMMQQ